MPTEFISYARHSVTREDINAVLSALCSDRLTQGPKVVEFEEALAKRCGAKCAVAVSSGTAALHLAYLACGVGPDTTVLTTPVTFVATANAALYCGANVKFTDTDERGWWWQYQPPDFFDELIPKYEFVLPVTLGGRSLDWRPHPLVTAVLDACHGPLSLPSGVTAACFSFHPCKHVAAGEGGAVVTNDRQIANKCRALRDHGRLPWYDDEGQPTGNMVCMDLGMNYRLNELSAALALSQLQRYDWNVEQRRRIAGIYDEAFKAKAETVPHSPQSARHLYQILHDARDCVRECLAGRGVQSQIHYAPIVPLQPYYKQRFGYRDGMWPNAEKYAARTLSLPLFPTLTDQEIETVIRAVLDVV